MTPIFFNSSNSHTYSPYPSDHHENQLGNHQISNPNSQQALSSSNSLATHLFLNSAVDDQSGTFAREIQPPQYQQEGDNFGSQAYNDHSIESNDSKSLEFSTWGRSGINDMINNDQNQMKWMSSKMRVMLKMKKSDPVNIKFYSSATRETAKHEDHKSPSWYPMEETDNSSNSTSSNNTNIPIRVCSDCNTTKTPLWRSGPQGPKSLCNACGIRQRKARRALAVAAAAENGNTNILGDQSSMIVMAPLKTQLKDFKKPNNGHVTKYKQKRQHSSKHIKTTMATTTITPPSPLSPAASPSPSPSPSSSSPSPSSSSLLARKNCVEDFLESLSKNLTFNFQHAVFPQDEKEAAILLMAISCGYAHET